MLDLLRIGFSPIDHDWVLHCVLCPLDKFTIYAKHRGVIHTAEINKPGKNT